MTTFESFNFLNYYEDYSDIKNRFSKYINNVPLLKKKLWNHYRRYGRHEGRIVSKKNVTISELDKQPIINKYISVYINNNVNYFNVQSKMFIEEFDDLNKEEIYIVINDKVENIETLISDLYVMYAMCNCDLLCPSVYYDENLLYFGGYILNNEIYCINSNYLNNFDEKHVLYYNTNTSIIYRNVFVTNSFNIFSDINNNNNNNNIIQYSKYNFKDVMNPKK